MIKLVFYDGSNLSSKLKKRYGVIPNGKLSFYTLLFLSKVNNLILKSYIINKCTAVFTSKDCEYEESVVILENNKILLNNIDNFSIQHEQRYSKSFNPLLLISEVKLILECTHIDKSPKLLTNRLWIINKKIGNHNYALDEFELFSFPILMVNESGYFTRSNNPWDNVGPYLRCTKIIFSNS